MSTSRIGILLAVVVAVGLGAAPGAAAPDPLKVSRRCRDAIAKSAATLAATAAKLTEACHARRNQGKIVADCNDLLAADPKGKLARADAKARATIAKRCPAGEPVLANYPGRNAAAAVVPAVRDAVAASAAALQGLPSLAGDGAAAKCHAELGKARSKIVAEILKDTLRCQKAIDKRAAVFGPVDPACLADPVKAAPRAVKALAKKCAGIAGPDVGSCAPLPACLVDAATATARQLAAAIFAKPSACDDGFRDPGEACPLLEGAPDEPALEAVHDLDTGHGVPDAEIELDADGAPIARTQLEIGFVADAPVAGVNAVLASIGAEIVSMLDDVMIVVVRIPDPGSLAALAAIVAALEADPLVRFATPGGFPATADLPANHFPGTPELAQIDHHLAIGAHAAWNARRAALAPPAVVVADFFGNGPVDADADVAPAGGGYGTGSLEAHGYHVLGIVAARFGGAETDRQRATGVAAFTVPTVVVDYEVGPTTTLTTAQGQNRMLQLVRATPGNVVVNTSLQFRCSTAALAASTCNASVAAAEGMRWIEKVRGTALVFGTATSLEDRFLHATAAGNVSAAGDLDARTASWYAAAALLPLAAPNLTNTLVVENVVNAPGDPFPPLCLSASSKRPGDVAAIGTDVWSFTDATGTAGNLTGTSMATPQVAGLAAYLWALEPAMSVAELRQAITDTARPIAAPGAGGGCDGAAPGPVVDAFAAVLALDRAVLPAPATAPVRRALLDVSDDGVFDAFDLESFLIEYVEDYVDGANHGATREPAARDYGRFDLNGDGFTGGGNRASFDLDRVGSTRYGASAHSIVETSVEGSPRPFDEAALTDLEILCYYAYSDLYTGSAAERRRLFDPAWCNPVSVSVAFPSSLEAGSPETLAVEVRRFGPNGEVLPYAGAIVELSATGGTLEQSGGTTDAEGRFETEAEVEDAASTMAVQVVVRAAAGGPPLAEETVTATNTSNPPGVFLTRRVSQVLSGIGFSYFEVFPPGGPITRREVRLWRDVLSERIDHLEPYEQEYSQLRSGSHAGATAATRSHFTHRSEVHLAPASGEFRGFDFEGAGDVFLELTNPGNEVQFFTFADGLSETYVEFEVRGRPVAFTFTASTGPTGDLEQSFVDVSFEGSAEDGTDVVIVDPDVPAPGPVNASGILQPGSYAVQIELLLVNRIDVNRPNGADDLFALEPRELSVNATLAIAP